MGTHVENVYLSYDVDTNVAVACIMYYYNKLIAISVIFAISLVLIRNISIVLLTPFPYEIEILNQILISCFAQVSGAYLFMVVHIGYTETLPVDQFQTLLQCIKSKCGLPRTSSAAP